jgi:hypothetical protein
VGLPPSRIPVKPLKKIYSIAQWERLKERIGPYVRTRIGAGVDTGRKRIYVRTRIGAGVDTGRKRKRR